MKLDRNLTKDGHGKYGLVLNRELKKRADEAALVIKQNRAPNDSELEAMKIVNAVAFLEDMGVIDWGTTPETEFFVIMLKDEYAGAALKHYARDVEDQGGDQEYADEVSALSNRAGRKHPNCKKPD